MCEICAYVFKKRKKKGSEELPITPKSCTEQRPVENKQHKGYPSKNVDLGRGGLVFSSEPFKCKEQKNLLLPVPGVPAVMLFRL